MMSGLERVASVAWIPAGKKNVGRLLAASMVAACVFAPVAATAQEPNPTSGAPAGQIGEGMGGACGRCDCPAYWPLICDDCGRPLDPADRSA